jgi:hypothetical protein
VAGVKFGDLAKYKIESDLVVSARHERWLETNSNPVYSEEALDFGREQLALQAKPRDRRGTISASSLGSCRRRQQFTFIGMPELPPSPKTAQIFQNGTFMHIRWQMAGLTEGWLEDAEVPVGNNDYGLSGTQDGIAYDDSVVELKSTNSNGFNRVMTFGPLGGHPFQVGTYVLTTGADKGVLLYENKDTQDWKEFVLTRDDLPLDEIEVANDFLWQAIAGKDLAEPLADCEAKTGYKYTGCPFRKQCLKIRSWEEAEEIAELQ